LQPRHARVGHPGGGGQRHAPPVVSRGSTGRATAKAQATFGIRFFVLRSSPWPSVIVPSSNPARLTRIRA
jgi:hypothetical protein